jgi:hypothetical protein
MLTYPYLVLIVNCASFLTVPSAETLAIHGAKYLKGFDRKG